MVSYGCWKSPITSGLVASRTVELGQIALDGEDVYWIEVRQEENGRHVVVRKTPAGRKSDVTPFPFNVRSRVHEYGGGAFAVMDGTVYFSNFADQRLYPQDPGSKPKPITLELDLRYVDGIVDGCRNRLICVREDHTIEGLEAINTLVTLDLGGSHGGRILLASDRQNLSPPDCAC